MKDKTDDQILWIYNGLDCAITSELFEHLEPQLEEDTTALIYQFERSMLAPAVTMMLRGFPVDEEEAARVTAEMEPKLVELGGMEKNARGKYVVTNPQALLQRYAEAVWGKPLNYNSPKQLVEFFYGQSGLNIPKHYHFDKGVRKVSTKREVLERVYNAYPRARPVINVLFKIRQYEKDLSVINCKRGDDGRIRTAFKIGGTETGRWASAESHFWDGTNLQNIKGEIRRMFVPDPGYEMFYADLKSAESIAVAYLSEDEAYMEACETADIHTYVARLVWPNDVPWSGDDAHDKNLASDTLYYRTYSYRDMSKRGGHGSNYHGTPRTMGRHLKVEERIMTRFQAMYFGGTIDSYFVRKWGFSELFDLPGVKLVDGYAPRRTKLGTKIVKTQLLEIPGAFPHIREWHSDIATELQEEGFLVTPLGRKRQFWSRVRDDATIREAIAYKPQSLVADILNIGLYRVWERHDGEDIQLLGQVHDAIVGQRKIATTTREGVTEALKSCMEFDVEVNGRTMRIPAEVQFGMNWKEASK